MCANWAELLREKGKEKILDKLDLSIVTIIYRLDIESIYIRYDSLYHADEV